MEKRDYLKTPIKHIDFTSFNAAEIINAMRGMSFTARDLAVASDIYDRMLADRECTIICETPLPSQDAQAMRDELRRGYSQDGHPNK